MGVGLFDPMKQPCAHRLKTLRNGIGNAISIPIHCNVSSSFHMNMIKFARALSRGDETGLSRDTKGPKVGKSKL